tara:strand:+ start:12395 stop:13018 length:624 start_codon:yes stop_codon:yes gene_type:complete
MLVRLAKISDIKQLAQIHLECGKNQPDGFMHLLGFFFLKTYYSILLNERKSVIVLAEDDSGFVHGFSSGTLAAEEHLMALKKNKIKLIISSIPALLISPKLIFKLLARNRYVNASANSLKFGVDIGSRCEYWAWRPEHKNLTMSINLFNIWRKIIFDLGIDSIKGEVDLKNKYIFKMHKILGANVVGELNLPDGRKRVIIEYTRKKK